MALMNQQNHADSNNQNPGRSLFDSFNVCISFRAVVDPFIVANATNASVQISVFCVVIIVY